MALTAMWLTGVEGSLPAAGVTARLYFATDTSRIFLDTGSAWVRLNLIPRGIYAGGTTYYDKDLVTYNGSVWRALATVTGVTPVEGANWTLFVSKGDAGSGLASIDGVSNTGGNVDLIAGTNVTITPDDTANTITIAASGSGAADASETVKGIAELATQAETDTGTDDARIVTPLKLATRTATATRTGVVELATDAETTTGTDTTRATTPANVKAAIDARFGYYTIPFSFTGTLTTTTGTLRAPIISTGTIVKVFAKVGTAPTGASILVDLNLNGSTIWSTTGNRVAIAISANSGTQTTFNTTAVTEDDYMTCDIDQIGSTVAGANLTVFIKIRYAL